MIAALASRSSIRNLLPPISARPQDTQICITLNGRGEFRQAEASLLKETPIPVSEASAARSLGNRQQPILLRINSVIALVTDRLLDSRILITSLVLIMQLSEWCSSEPPQMQALCIVLERHQATCKINF